MRLVDVEPLDFISFQTTGDTAYDQGFEDGVQFVAEKLDAAPTVDAIPVEWIRAKMDEQKREADKCIGNAAFTLAVIAPTEYLISEWHKEQEAR